MLQLMGDPAGELTKALKMEMTHPVRIRQKIWMSKENTLDFVLILYTVLGRSYYYFTGAHGERSVRPV